ncbi:hypothetical protein FEM48_Zijuj01G0207900 [Ziziphus jujuba var. spinosa]|uniref:Uncharacterized protein n=1 Tax=Ziziphus jujuba var. spinosa TaxID=714518 RepID=A0A978W3H1_ZIZJJ|nr:hypothetical protein FEM48_Zijuj01G0207900 [Ziziphus jujuba var. spinosa]
MERMKPGSCEVLISKLLQRLSSSKESSLIDLNDLAPHLFAKDKTASEETQNVNVEANNKKNQPNKEFPSNTNLSPLARFLLSRLVKWFLVMEKNALVMIEEKTLKIWVWVAVMVVVLTL